MTDAGDKRLGIVVEVFAAEASRDQRHERVRNDAVDGRWHADRLTRPDDGAVEVLHLRLPAPAVVPPSVFCGAITTRPFPFSSALVPLTSVPM